MTARRLKSVLIVLAAIAALALPATVAAQQAPSGSAEIHELYVHPSTTQAGGHPDVHLFFRFCDPIPHVIDATNATPIVITTLEPHGLLTGDSVAVRGVEGNLNANQQDAKVTVLDATHFELHEFGNNAPISG